MRRRCGERSATPSRTSTESGRNPAMPLRPWCWCKRQFLSELLKVCILNLTLHFGSRSPPASFWSNSGQNDTGMKSWFTLQCEFWMPGFLKTTNHNNKTIIQTWFRSAIKYWLDNEIYGWGRSVRPRLLCVLLYWLSCGQPPWPDIKHKLSHQGKTFFKKPNFIPVEILPLFIQV